MIAMPCIHDCVNDKPCCEICTNKFVQEDIPDNTALYCEVYEKYVKPNGLCQWYDGPKIWRKKRVNEIAEAN